MATIVNSVGIPDAKSLAMLIECAFTMVLVWKGHACRRGLGLRHDIKKLETFRQEDKERINLVATYL